VQKGLASSLDIQSIYTLVGDKIREIFAADTTFIAYKNEERNQLLAAYYADRKLRRSFNRPYGTGIAEAIIDSGRPLLLGSALEHRNFGAHHVASPGTKKDLNQSVLGVPIFRNDKPYGAVSIQSYAVNAFDENDLHLLQTLTNSMSAALENARLFDETQQRNAELAIINSVQEGLASKLDVQAIYELVGEKIRRTFNAQVVSIDTYDHDVRMLQGRYYFEADRVLAGATYPCFGFRRHVIENRQPIVINRDMQRWMEAYDNPVLQGLQPKSAIFIPMIVGGEAMGVISLQNNDQENAFSESDVRLLTTLSSSMSIALENARLWEEEKLYRRALQRELEIGREIQAGFLPETLPIIEGWEIAASLMSAREVAGDFYDAFELPDGNIGLVIADVCDKGVGAALFMTLFRSLIRAAANLDFFEHPGEINETLSAADRLQRSILLTNNYIAETHGDSGVFATIFFGILNPQDGKLAYINAGHEPPLIVRSGVVCEILHKTGPAVGAMTNCRFNQHVKQLKTGDMLFAFTDGVPDCRNLADEEFGRERLMAILKRVDESAHELIEAAEAELRDYIAGATQFDDITLLAVRQG
jgi:serine phosphatase RsbU (regulator of sigma subunit)